MRWLRRQLAALALASTAIMTGCGGSGAEPLPADPARAVAEASERTLEAGVRKLDLRVDSPTAEYSAAGLVEPSRGRFRVEARFRRAPALRKTDDKRLVAVGTDRRTTLEEYFTRFEGERQRCWLEPHLPVGSYGGATSVEESVRLVAAALEALRERVASATARAGGGPDVAAYDATLKPLPPEGREERQAAPGLQGTAARLLGKLDRPIRLSASEDGRIVELRLELRDYRPRSYLRGSGEPERVTIEARLSEARSELRLAPPECMGME